MKAFEFPGHMMSDGRLAFPDDVRNALTANRIVRVLLLVDEPEDAGEDEAWSRVAARQLPTQYGKADDIYDRVP